MAEIMGFEKALLLLPFVILVAYSRITTATVSDRLMFGVEKENVAVGKSLTMWCGVRPEVDGDRLELRPVFAGI